MCDNADVKDFRWGLNERVPDHQDRTQCTQQGTRQFVCLSALRYEHIEETDAKKIGGSG